MHSDLIMADSVAKPLLQYECTGLIISFPNKGLDQTLAFATYSAVLEPSSSKLSGVSPT